MSATRAGRLGGTPLASRRRRPLWRSLAPRWSPAGLVIAAATLLALALRLFLLFQSHFLTSGAVEYDDGVYLGAAMRLLHGAVPYKDYAFIQPPGILIVALPAAVVAKLAGATTGLALARAATVGASAACVALAGNLVRHRGVLVTLVTCGLLAVYPADIMAARTLLLEPWMNLCCLLAANAAFRSGRLAGPRGLAWAGLALGFAATIKFWAGVPAAVLLVVILAVPGQRLRRAGAYVAPLAAGFLVPVAAMAGSAPRTFLRGTLIYQATRAGQSAPMALRLDHLTGLITVLGEHGVALGPGSYSLFIFDASASMAPTTTWALLPEILAIVLAAVILLSYLARPRERTHLEWFALATAAGACAAILGYSAFFYHYPAFPGPWLAIAAGAGAGALAGNRARARTALTAVTCVLVACVAVLEGIQMTGMTIQPNPGVSRIIPPGACVVTDQVALTIAADRFTAAQPGCPEVIDSLAQTLVLSHGKSPQGGAGNRPGVVAAWEAMFGRAQYVWLTGGTFSRIPWTPELQAWFSGHFHLVRVMRGYADSRLYMKN